MHSNGHPRPRVGVPWRTASEEAAGRRGSYDQYLRAIREAGAQPVEISLALPLGELSALVRSLDAFVLSGSPADMDPNRFGAHRHPATARPDKLRERADDLILDDALETQKPVLAICFGIQSLNVHLGGSLVQDIASELGEHVEHNRDEGSEARHLIHIEAGRLSELAQQPTVRVNSSHHQSVLKPGRGLRVTARAGDGVVEALEWNGAGWIVGVQWHPERMPGDPLAEALFARLIAEAQARGAATNPR